MPKPSIYETLTSKQFFRKEPAPSGATQVLLSDAQDHLTASKLLSASGFITPSFTAAYEGLSQLFRTMFEYRGVRPVDGCWTSATQVVCRDLGMNVAEQCFVSVLHDMRNPTSRNSSSPSASAAEAHKVADILEKYLLVAHALMHQSSLTKVTEQHAPV